MNGNIVELIRLWANDPDAGVPPTIPTEYALLAVDEIERLHELIIAWADADDDPADIDGPYHAAWLALRRAVGR